MPRSSPADGPSLLIVAASGRALAAAARRAGFAPLVADFFADRDTVELSGATIKLPDEIRHGLQWETLSRALEELAQRAPSPPLGLVYGSGFEDRPALLGRIAAQYRIVGNDSGAVTLVKDPEIFFNRLAKLGFPHPATSLTAPKARSGWLAKRRGGAGGSHIVQSRALLGASPAMAGGEADAERGLLAAVAETSALYFQKKVQGRSVSALFLANGSEARVLGFSEQWTAPRRGARFRYGGAARPADLSQALAAKMRLAAETAAASFKLKGLGSVDFLIEGDEALLLEINPRPGATLDIYDNAADPLLNLHLDAVLRGKLPQGPLARSDASAAAIVYATRALVVPEALQWPDWTADRPKAGERIDKGRPICTVSAHADSLAEAKRLVQERIATIAAACSGRQNARS